MRKEKSLLLRMVLTFTLTMTLLLIAGMAVYADGETHTITIHWSSVDGVDLMDPIVIDNITSGKTVYNAISAKGLDPNKLFEKDGYINSNNWYSKPVTEDSTWDNMYPFRVPSSKPILSDLDIYYLMNKALTDVELTLEPPLCGTETTGTIDWENETNPPKFSVPSGVKYRIIDEGGQDWSYWDKDPTIQEAYMGKFTGGELYYCNVYLEPDFGYCFPYDYKAKVNNATVIETTRWYDLYVVTVLVSVIAAHDWDAGKVTKEPTETAEGVKTYTCNGCGATKTEAIPKLAPANGADGTPFGKGASVAAAEAAILALPDDNDPAGTAFGLLQLKATKATKNSINLNWKAVPGAAKYIIFANKCGTGNKYKKLGEVTGTSLNVTQAAGAALQKGTYYKFMMIAADANGKVVSTSKTVHAATKGGKVGNHKKVTVSKAVTKKAKKLKKGKTLKLKAKAVPQARKLKVKKHRAIKYETSNAAVAQVNSKGTVKGVGKGTCYIYAYAQNGVFRKIKVTVK